MARKRNPRGQGERLRDDIIEAASRLLADPAAPPLTLRAVAREVGVAATSVYLHFDSIDTLTLAFQQLIERVAACLGADPEAPEDQDDQRAFFTAQLIWQQLHGIVSLRISRSKFPWPALEPTVRTAVEGLLATAQNHL
jgi:AcrR family transcriptional regulator